MTMKQSDRRKLALIRLQSQLKSGVKPVKGTVGETENLTEKDIARIQKEILTIKSRLG